MQLQSDGTELISLTSEEWLESVILNTTQILRNLAQDDRFSLVLETAFGDNFLPEAAAILHQEWLNETFLENIEVSFSNELGGALGAYAAASNRIYLSPNLETLEEATAVFLEEVGHAIDARLNKRDTPGDEGAIFSALVRGETLSESQLQTLRAEDDIVERVVNQEVTVLEQANLTVTNLNDDGSAGSLREVINTANTNGEADVITFDSALSGTINLSLGELLITDDLEIVGLGEDQLTINGSGIGRVFKIDDTDPDNDVNVSISEVTITGGRAIEDGGAGIFNNENLTLANSTVSGNIADYNGGGIYNYGTVTLTSSTVSGNTASEGGGIYNASSHYLTLVNSTVSGNYANFYNGGGGGIKNQGEATILNSTISGNNAADTGHGIYNGTTGNATIRNATIANNNGEGLYNYEYGNVTIANTIIANNVGSDVVEGLNPIVSNGFNIVADGSITGANIINSQPLLDLAGLQDNGGPTETIALETGSPAIDAGDNGEIPGDTLDEDDDGDIEEDILFDQRGLGFNRVINGVVDIGAFEAPDTLIVDNLVDENDGDFSTGDLSLREAIAEIEVGGIITFDPELLEGIIGLDSALGELLIDKALTIDGEENNITINAGGGSRVFNIDDDNSESEIDVTINGLTITGGNVSGDGAGILNAENLTLTNSTVSLNTATDGGGVSNEGNASFRNSTITGNYADLGGGFFNYGNASFSNTTISNNEATNNGGGIYNFSDNTVSLINSTVTTNVANQGGGILNLGSAALNVSTVSGNSATASGGGLYNFGEATLNISTISGNTADTDGGGIYNPGTVTLNTSTVSANTASSNGGGVSIGEGGVANLNNSTVSTNLSNASGGGLLIASTAMANLSNSTVFGNTANDGGALANSGEATIANSTIAGNTATYDGAGSAGIVHGSDSITTIESAIVADNLLLGSPNDIGAAPGGGGTVDVSFSLVENGIFTDGGNNITATDPLLDPDGLKRNGGFIQTIALQSGSPVIDEGSNPDALSFDQRGPSFDREINAVADMGAFEFQNGANTAPISVELRLLEDRGAGLVDITSTGEVFTTNFVLEVLVADERTTPAGVVSATFDLTFNNNELLDDPTLVENTDDFAPASIEDIANPVLTSSFPLFRDGTLDNIVGEITALGAGALTNTDPPQGSAIGVGTLDTFSTLSFQEDSTRSPADNGFAFSLTIDPGQTGFADGVFADPDAVSFTQNVTLNNPPTLDPIPDSNIAENAIATDIVLVGTDIIATDDGLGNEVTFTLTNVPTDLNDDPLFAFFDSSETGDNRFVSTSTVAENFPLVVTPAGEATLDFEDVSSYSVGITASDGFKDSEESTFTVNVTDVEQAIISVDSSSVIFGTPVSSFRENASDSTLVRPTFPDTFRSVTITNSTPVEDSELLQITEFIINAPNVSILNGNVPQEGDILLNPGESHTVTLKYEPAGSGESFNVPDGLVINSNSANAPIFGVGLIGESTFNSDINYDGIVDLNDLAVLEQTPFLSSLGDPGYDPSADINGDTEINRGDLIVLNSEIPV